MPQLVLPLIYDQFGAAERMEHIGAGVRLQRRDFEEGGGRRSGGGGGEGGGGGGGRRGVECILRAIREAAEPEAVATRETLQALVAEEEVMAAVWAVIEEQREATSSLPALATTTSTTPASSLPLPRTDGLEAADGLGGGGGLGVAGGLGSLLDAARKWKRRREEGCGGEEGRATAKVVASSTAAANSISTTTSSSSSSSASAPCPELIELGDDRMQVWCHSPSEALYIHDEIYVRSTCNCHAPSFQAPARSPPPYPLADTFLHPSSPSSPLPAPSDLPRGSGIALPSSSTASSASSSSSSLIVDVGANVGLFTLWAAARCNPNVAPPPSLCLAPAPSVPSNTAARPPLLLSSAAYLPFTSLPAVAQVRLLAIEPAGRTFDLLTRNLRDHGCKEHVRTVRAALGAAKVRG